MMSRTMNENTEVSSVIRMDIVTAHPGMFESVINTSIIKIAREKKIADIFLHNLHDYALDRYKHIDDAPYGGGAGMIIMCQPVFDCIDKLKSERDYDEVIYMTADGEVLNQMLSNRLSLCGNLIILAGHYKGVDQRIRDALITKEISIGDYVLSGGELPAMVMIDSIARLIPGVLGDAESALEDSFQEHLLEPPYYTKPADYRGMKVPDVLLNGNHREINIWKESEAERKTRLRRPDLL
jgi:tRNA (guanine37-N1)-methyltransferase